MTKKQVFSNIVKILRKKGERYKKTVGDWLSLSLNGGRTLIYDTVFGFMSLETGHKKYNDRKYFGEDCKIIVFYGTEEIVEVSIEELNKLLKEIK